jgi:hypothetical protein
LEDFELFAQELRKMYGDKDRPLNSAMKAMQEYQQISNESVRVYADQMKANWRRAGWNQIMHDVVLYNMAWSGLRHAVKTKVRAWIQKDNDLSERLDELFDCAAALESKPEEKQRGGQQQQQQRHPDESHMGGIKKREFKPAIAEPVATPQVTPERPKGDNKDKGNLNVSFNHNNLPPAPWVATEVYQSRRENGQCGGDHKAYRCTKYSKATFPDQTKNLTPGTGSNQVKRQRSFDNSQSKNQSISLDTWLSGRAWT